MSNPKAKFFCEYCDTEVPQKAIVCPKCGHFFASVRCPQCGHTGTQSEFLNGCRSCGYAFTPGNTSQKSTQNKTQTKLPPKAKYKTRQAAIHEIEKREDYKKREDALPAWVYIFSISLLVVLLIALLSQS